MVRCVSGIFKTNKIIFFLSLVLMPKMVFGAIVISEIMYDLDGSDSGREWIEIKNNGNDSADLTDWKLFEGGTNHKLNLISGDYVLKAGQYAVVADNSDKFYLDYPLFNGTLFDSSFSLNNTGELLIIKDSNLNEIDSVTYNNSWGAGGDGNSLNKINSAFLPRAPSPGRESVETVLEKKDGNLNGNEETVTPTENPPSGQSNNSQQDFNSINKKNISVFITSQVNAIVGVPHVFKAEAYGFINEPLSNAQYLWSFGDGSYSKIMNTSKTYLYEGEYSVSVIASSGENSASDRFKVKAVKPDVIIYAAKVGEGGYVEIKNNSNFDIDLSGWRLISAKQSFTIPFGTFIIAQNSIKFPNEITLLDIGEILEFHYPNGAMLTSYSLSRNQPDSLVKNENKEVMEQTGHGAVAANISPKDISSKKNNTDNLAAVKSGIAVFSDFEEGAVKTGGGGEVPEEIGLEEKSYEDYDKNYDKSRPLGKWFVWIGAISFLGFLGFLLARGKKDKNPEFEIID